MLHAIVTAGRQDYVGATPVCFAQPILRKPKLKRLRSIGDAGDQRSAVRAQADRTPISGTVSG